MAKTPIESPSTNSILRCSSFTEVRVEDFPAWDNSSKSATIARIVKGTPSQPVDLFSIAKIQTNLEYKYAENLRNNGRIRVKFDKWLVHIPFLCYLTILLISAEGAVYGGY